MNNKDNPTVKCKICGEKTLMFATELCNNCWEVTTRLPKFLLTQYGRNTVQFYLGKANNQYESDKQT